MVAGKVAGVGMRVVNQLKARGQRAYAPTLRGSEAGNINRAGIILQDIADGLATFLLERDLNDILLVGHSGGGAGGSTDS